jgi:hypothetical protein
VIFVPAERYSAKLTVTPGMAIEALSRWHALAVLGGKDCALV